VACGWGASLQDSSSEADAIAANAESDSDDTAAPTQVSEAEQKFWQALKLFRSKKPSDLATARGLLEESVAKEFPHAQLHLGELYQAGGHGYPRNLKKSAAYLRLAAERGNAFAKVSYGIALFSGIGERKDDEKALHWLTAAVAPEADYSRPHPPKDFFAIDGKSEGDRLDEGVAGAATADPVASTQARAHYLIGVIHESRKNLAEAQSHYVAAATAGVAGRDGVQQAATQAAINFAMGKGVPRDSHKANEMLDHSRKLGRHLGIATIHNYATAKLVDEFAVSELEEAISKASDEAAGEMQLNIARLLTDRKSKDYNPNEAVRWFELAAESGKPWAMLELALLYSRGETGAPEPEKAFAWFERAGSGDTPKHYLGVANLIISHHNGIGTPKNPAKAREIANLHRENELVSHLTLLGECPGAILTYEQILALNTRWATKLKDPQAQYLMGLRNEGGFSGKRSFKGAVSWYKKAMKVKHGPSARQLGLLYEANGQAFGLMQGEAWRKAVECYQVGANAGDARAMAFLANMIANGRGTPWRENEAKSLYEKSVAIDPNLSLAWNNLGGIYERRFREAKFKRDDILAHLNRTMMMSCYEKSDSQGFAWAANNLGLLYHTGILGEKDFQKAYGYFERAAGEGHRDARFRLGEMHEKGEGVPVTQVEAAYHYRLAALDHHPEALKRLVDFYLQGKGGAQDMDRAQFWLRRMYENGDIGALATYANLAMRQKRYEEAVKLFEFLKDVKDRSVSALAYHRLSGCYRDGLGVKAKLSRAKFCRQKALELGSVEAMYAVAMENFAQGNKDAAVASMIKIANQSSDAAYRLGQLYYHGQDIEPDLDKAMSYLRSAASRIHGDALYFLAGMTYNKANGAPELEEAIKFAQSADAVGHPEAAALREKLERRRNVAAPPPEETAGTRST
jgi:TPR repeat protein